MAPPLTGGVGRAITIEPDDEVEGDVVGTTDFVFRRIGDGVPLLPPASPVFDLTRPPNRPLAVSDRFAAVFVAHPDGFLVVKTKEAIEAAKEVKEKGKRHERCLQDCSVVDVPLPGVSLLALSGDSSVLAACVGGEIYFYLVDPLLKKDHTSSFSSKLGKSDVVKDFRWQTGGTKSYIILSDQGSLYCGRPNEDLKVVMDDVDAFDCGRGGYVALARKNTLSILSPEFKEQLCLTLCFQSWISDTDSENEIKVDSLAWVRDDTIVVGCVQLNESGDETGYLVQVIRTETGTLIEGNVQGVISFPYLFEGIVDDILPSGSGPHLLLSYVNNWELALTANRKNTSQHVQLLKWSSAIEEGKVVWLELQNDKYIPRIDLQENDEENILLGFGAERVSLFEKIDVQVGADVKEIDPRIIFLCLTCEAKLLLYHVARISDPPDNSSPIIHFDDNNASESLLAAGFGNAATATQPKGNNTSVNSPQVPLPMALKETPRPSISAPPVSSSANNAGVLATGNNTPNGTPSVSAPPVTSTANNAGVLATGSDTPNRTLPVLPMPGRPGFPDVTKSSVKTPVMPQTIFGGGFPAALESSQVASSSTSTNIKIHSVPPSSVSKLEEGSSHGNTLTRKISGNKVQPRSGYADILVDEMESIRHQQKNPYSITGLTKELDTMLSLIENDGGFMDACITYQQQSVSGIEDSLFRLSEATHMYKLNTQKQASKIEDLRGKIIQVQSGQIYMHEGDINRNDQYLGMRNNRRLSSDLDGKKQSILKASQSLTNQLKELETYFHSLEVNRFGDKGRNVAARRGMLTSAHRSRQTELHSVYNALNSQLAAAEQLSQCLSEQMATLKISSSSAKQEDIKKELFESIGLVHNTDKLESPNTPKSRIAPNSINRFSELPKGSSVASKVTEFESSRRRRQSLDRDVTSMEPQTTTVKRMQQPRPMSRFQPSIAGRKILYSELESSNLLKGAGSPSTVDLQLDIPKPQNQAFPGDAAKPTSGAQPKPADIWVTEPSGALPGLRQPQNQFTVPAKVVPVQPILSNTRIIATSGVATATSTQTEYKPNSLRTELSFSLNASDIHPAVNEFAASVMPAESMPALKPSPVENKNLFTSNLRQIPSMPSFGSTNQPGSSPPKFSGFFKQGSSAAPSFSFPVLQPAESSTRSPQLSGTTTQTIPIVSNAQTSSIYSPVQSALTSGAESSVASPEANAESITPSPTSATALLQAVTASSQQSVPTREVPKLDTLQEKPGPDQSAVPAKEIIAPVVSVPETHPVPSQSLPASSVPAPSVVPPAISASTGQDNILSSEEDDMEEEEVTDASSINFGALGGFGLQLTPPSKQKTNPFGGSFMSSSAVSSSASFAMTTPAGALFRPSSLSIPSTSASFSGSSLSGGLSSFGQPSQVGAGFSQPSQIGAGFGQPSQISSGFGQPLQIGSGFGQPAQIGGAGQQALGSVLGSFGQSRQPGGAQGLGFAAAANLGSGGGFPSASAGGFGGFSATSGGAFSSGVSGGFAGAAASGGFAALASKGGGFAAAAASTGGGFAGAGQAAGFGSGGFELFGNNQGGGSFSAFGGAAGSVKPPPELLTQMRK